MDENAHNSFTGRLESLRGKEPVSSFARRCGLNESVVRAYLSGRSGPTLKTALDIAANLGVSAAWLATGEEQPKMLGKVSREELVQVSPTGEFEVDGETFVGIPIFKVEASAGAGAYVHLHNPIKAFTVSADWARRRFRSDPANLSVVTARGESMRPTIDEDDVLLIDHAKALDPSDGIYVLMEEDLLMVKRVILLPRGRARLVSDNPHYPAREVDLGDGSVKLIGRVVWHGHNF